jgi:ribonuclease J
MNLAKKHGRKVALTGRSLVENVALARELGYLKIPDRLLVDIGTHIPDKQLLILSTGSQGEPRSALNRMAQGEHPQIKVKRGDSIIISGGTIPGNEEEVGRMLNKLFERGANVIYGKLATVHVSGHSSRDEMQIILQSVKPKFLIPVHGETRHLHLHARLAENVGMNPKNVFILNNGSVWATDGTSAWLDTRVPAQDVWVDGRLVGEIGSTVIQDRQRLSQDGFIVALIPVNASNKLAGEPEIISRGFVPVSGSSQLLQAARKEIWQQFRRDKNIAHERITEVLQNFFYRETESRPVVLPSIIRV